MTPPPVAAATLPSAHVAPAEDIVMASQLLGNISVPKGQIYHFKKGIYGFPDAHGFALLPVEREGFFWMQSLENEALTFLLIDPFRFVPGYTVDLPEGAVDDIEATDADGVLVLAILTLPREEGQPTTANLKGPLVLDVVRKKGSQMVIESEFGLRHAIQVTPS